MKKIPRLPRGKWGALRPTTRVKQSAKLYTRNRKSFKKETEWAS